MQAQNKDLLLQVLINRFHGEATEAFLRPLPEELSQALLVNRIDADDPAPLLVSAAEKIERDHYSWLIPTFEKLPKEELPLMLAALPQPHRARLKEHFALFDTPELADPVRRFFLDRLGKQIGKKKALPLEYLPETELQFLLDWKKQRVTSLIDYLGLYDLADEMRHTVNKKRLQQLFSCLSEKQVAFVKRLMMQQSKITGTPLKLRGWGGDKQSLQKILHKRGLARLGRALCGQHSHFFWHVCHRLDTGRAAILRQYYKREPLVGVTPILLQQVAFIRECLEKKRAS